jgi:hypothetical protein
MCVGWQVPKVQSAFVLQSTHWPFSPSLDVSQTWPFEQSVLAWQGSHVFVFGLHTGAPPEQSMFDWQPTHVPVVVSQMAVLPVQADVFVASHWTQAPFVPHRGVAPVQSAAVHARHVSLVVSQMGVGTAQLESTMHPTHCPAFGAVVLVWQTGVVPVQPMPLSYSVQGRQLGSVERPSQMGICATQESAKSDQMSCTV